MQVGTEPTTQSVLGVLSRQRLAQLGRALGVEASASASKEALLTAFAEAHRPRFRELVGHLQRDELRAACRAHGLDESGRARSALAARLLHAHGDIGSVPPPAIFKAEAAPRYAPRVGDIVRVRHRQHLVEAVTPAVNAGDATLVDIVCLDDDAQGRQGRVLWELELGAQVLQPETHGLGDVARLDPPRQFAAYLHALKWNAVTATDARLFQAPFRAGIKLFNHQLTALKKALELPRANLFIADDVGLGKTVEAGLVLQELLLRQRVDFVLIVAPASVALQWRSEMSSKFGLQFEIYNRAFVARRRQERGFGVNPWTTHNRFIISYPTLRRPEYRDPLLQHVGERVRKSLLILDEAHTAAPASASKYAIDSRITRVVRDVAPRFENRLFLSATPHNGHSNSFSSLLEVLDPQRFTRGVPVRNVAQLEPVMVRRLKSDLRQVEGVEQFPERKVVAVELLWERDACLARFGTDEDVKPVEVGRGAGVELELSRMLAEYTAIMKPQKGRGQLVFINLQKRLLSSVEAFYRTLQLHARGVGAGTAATALQLDLEEPEADEYGLDDEAQEAGEGAAVAGASRLLQTPAGRARQLLDDMLHLAEQHRGAPDGKMLALLEWVRRHQCRAVQVGGAARGDRSWSDRRVIIFTEYGDTKRALVQLLAAAVEGTDQGDDRIMQFHGGMSDEQRDEVQRAFNSPADEHAVRILIATDAAREGVNLQGHCADLFHYDIPWNPARMEQRNGRIDRALQPEPEVRCHYFDYPQRPEDAVLRTLVRKVDTITRELGSLGEVVMARWAEVMERGLGDATLPALDEAEQVGGLKATVGAELEAQRADLARLSAEIDDAGKILNSSKKVMDFDPALLRDALDVGLELAGAARLEPAKRAEAQTHKRAYDVPEMPDSWQETLDHLRPPRGRDEPFWEWRRRQPMPVVFEPPPRMNSALVHLHLQHPLVQRLLSRFLAQGFSAHDLSRATVVRTRHDSIARVIAFGRLSLFGPGATRLHDQLVSVAAQWLESKGAGHLRPFADEADRRALDRLEQLLTESPSLEAVSPTTQARLAVSAPGDFATLWPAIRDEADAKAVEAGAKLEQRGADEAEKLRAILNDQRDAILVALGRHQQMVLEFNDSEKDQREQFEADMKHMEARLVAIDRELETEPKQLTDLYHVVLRRLEPVGLVYLWPETRS